MQTWPEGVPHEPLARSFQGEPFREGHVTEFEDGPFRARPSSTLPVATLRFTIRMGNAAFETFKAWVTEDLVMGTRRFTMPVWTGSAYATKTCQFRERYRDDPGHGLRHRVSIVIDVEDY